MPNRLKSDQFDASQWDALQEKTIGREKKSSARSIFGDAAARGSVYRWGFAVAVDGPCPARIEVLSRLACGESIGKKHRTLDLVAQAESFIDLIDSSPTIDALIASEAVLWAASLPRLCADWESAFTYRLLTSLCELHESVITRSQSDGLNHLILAGELGLTLAWRMEDLPSCKRLQRRSLDAISQWCQQVDQSVSAAVAGGRVARLVLASLIRCESLMRTRAKRKFTSRHVAAADLLSTWVIAMTTPNGGSAMSSVARKDAIDDITEGGLLDRASRYDAEALGPALAAAIGETQTGGRLAWEVSLPETMWHDPDAKLAILMPEWDVRRGRTHLDYSGEEIAIEVFAGRRKVISGVWQTMLEIDDEQQYPSGPWTETCEYTDDDVHYLEIEQPWSGGVLLQRQVMLVREDRCLYLADAVVPENDHPDWYPDATIKYWSRLPLADGIDADPEPDTRELFLSDGRRRAMVMPIAANEWRVGATSMSLAQSEDGHMTMSSTGAGRLYCPLWIDLAQRRFKRKRTWRQLTVVNDLRVCAQNEAVGYRIQVGSEQWMVYRTLGEPKTRSVLGKHLIADFFASRFDPTYGDHDALVTVDDSEPGEE